MTAHTHHPTYRPIPVIGCRVRLTDSPNAPVAPVIRHQHVPGGTLLVLRHDGDEITRHVHRVCSGFAVDQIVKHVPSQVGQRSLGEGRVIALRRRGGWDQVAVQFSADGATRWMSYATLALVPDVRRRFALGDFGAHADEPERFRLRMLAHALTMWNEQTGALSNMEIDPLPHQLGLVHEILKSGQLNWMIADDVGLGKTIMMGMLLAALEGQRDFRRILIVAPASLTVQWQEELEAKFGLSHFEVYGRDFQINSPAHWALHDRVIASIDRLKHRDHLERLAHASHWDLVVFDEAHKLTRREYGLSYVASDRYRLAARLREVTDNLMMLTATPHQGRQDMFRALLELLRPDLSDSIDTIESNPEILADMIYRNRKSQVVNADGELIFRGQIATQVVVPTSDEERAFDDALQDYLRRGYAAADDARSQVARAIGFVMTVFRKLAASSHAAILRSLRRRRAKLRAEANDMNALVGEIFSGRDDARFAGEVEESELFAKLDQLDIAVFFDGELEMLEQLIELGQGLLDEDSKLDALMEDVLAPMLAKDPARKLLIFTEFRATQDYLVAALAQRLGARSVGVINGSMSLDDKRDTVRRFADDLQILVSTEAGGEGLNMHQRCHTMVNYDLPWNPMRLVQRAGRLYRYGQEHPVVVLNMHCAGTLDGRIQEMLYQRIDTIVEDLGDFHADYDHGLREQILGDICQLADVTAILEQAANTTLEHTEEALDAALERARDAARLQDELLSFARSYDVERHAEELQLGTAHVESFVAGMLRACELPVVERTHGGAVTRIALNDRLRDVLGTRAESVRITTSREHAQAKDIQMMDFTNPLMRWLVDRALDESFGGHCAAIEGLPGEMLAVGRACWQSEHGQLVREEIVGIVRDAEGARIDQRAVSEALLRAQRRTARASALTREQRVALVRHGVLEVIDDVLAQGSSRFHIPMLGDVLGIAERR